MSRSRGRRGPGPAGRPRPSPRRVIGGTRGGRRPALAQPAQVELEQRRVVGGQWRLGEGGGRRGRSRLGGAVGIAGQAYPAAPRSRRGGGRQRAVGGRARRAPRSRVAPAPLPRRHGRARRCCRRPSTQPSAVAQRDRGSGRGASGDVAGNGVAVDARVRRAVPPRARRSPRTGTRPAPDTRRSAAPGRQNVAPTSMTACVQSAGRSGGTDASAIAWRSRGGNASRVPPTARPSTRRTFVSTAPTGIPNAIAATARAVYGPTPGRRSSAARSRGTRRRARRRRPAPRATGSAPAGCTRARRQRPEDVGRRRVGEGRDRRKGARNAAHASRDAADLRLLGHHLRDEDGVRVGRRRGTAGPAVRVVPARGSRAAIGSEPPRRASSRGVPGRSRCTPRC